MNNCDFPTFCDSHQQEVFDWLRGAGLKLKLSKFALLQPKEKYLGHVVGRNNVAMDLGKVWAVEDCATP